MNYKELLNDIVNENKEFRPITEKEKQDLQTALYEMACDLDNICRTYNIKLFLVGGSLLGAVRHGGFIPWDDDMDFALSRKDYEKLKEIFDDKLGEKYILRCPNSSNPSGNRFMQIFKKDTVLKTLGDQPQLIPQKIYIDIFPYDYVPKNFFYRFVRGTYANICMAIASCVMDFVYPDEGLTSYMKKNKKGKRILVCKSIVGKIFSFKKTEKWFDLVDDIINYRKSTSIITSGTGRKHYFGEIYSKNIFFPLKQMSFINHEFYVPSDTNSYLIGLYGENYMNPPAINQRESHFISELKV